MFSNFIFGEKLANKFFGKVICFDGKAFSKKIKMLLVSHKDKVNSNKIPAWTDR